MDKLVLPDSAGLMAMGLKIGLIVPHDDMASITAEAVKPVAADNDIVCITEAVVARSQNRYVTCKEMALEVQEKLNLKPGSTLAVISPIASRNRFALIMKTLAMATRGGKVIVQMSIPFDEVGNQVVDEEFVTTRLRLKKTLQSLLDARGNTPMLNVLIREIVAALKLQEIGYHIIAIRKITGQGIADLTVRTPEGKLAVVEVTFADMERAANKAIEIKRDVPGAELAMAAAVNLEHKYLTLVDAKKYVEKGEGEAVKLDFSQQQDSYTETDAIFTNEMGDLVFSHPVTGVDYRELYLQMIQEGGAKGKVIFTNNPLKVYNLGYIDGVCIGAVHEREKLRELFHSFGAMVPVTTIREIGPEPWGLIGSNVSDYEEGVLKLLPEDANETAEDIKRKIYEETGKDVEILIFGDGAYKDPDTGIYELADPHPAVGVSSGLKNAGLRTGTKLKLLVDTLHRQGYSREEIIEYMEKRKGETAAESLGTTPRSATSIIATLADLVAGSADAGTPIVLVRGFNLSKE
ncbi:MAG: F420-0--gamma-glutamyl ligase [Clostridia bacterium]|nr:F420-0--gamma-glutamyl ligase [Clostridia bacterium]